MSVDPVGLIGGGTPLTLAPDAVLTDRSTGMQHVGRTAIRAMLHHLLHETFDARLEQSTWTVHEETALLEADLVGRRLHPYAGAPADGQTVRLPLAVACQHDRREITLARLYLQATALQQDGASVTRS